jgi:hypothetical protein
MDSPAGDAAARGGASNSLKGNETEIGSAIVF